MRDAQCGVEKRFCEVLLQAMSALASGEGHGQVEEACSTRSFKTNMSSRVSVNARYRASDARCLWYKLLFRCSSLLASALSCFALVIAPDWLRVVTQYPGNV